MFSYIVLLYEVGYYISTPVALAALMRHFGMKKWGVTIIICVAVTSIIYFVFYRLMDVVLPEGEIFR